MPDSGTSEGQAHGQESRIAPLVLCLREGPAGPERRADEVELEAL